MSKRRVICAGVTLTTHADGLCCAGRSAMRGKRKYRSKRHALGKWKTPNFTVYKCEACGSWHRATKEQPDE